MKKIAICLALLFIAASSFCQQTNPANRYTREDYLKKSKNQKTGAWVLLGGGSALILIGVLVGDRKEASFDDAATGGIIAAIGILSAIGSVPLFLASARNKRKAMNASASFRFERIPTFNQTGFNFRQYPSILVKLNL